MQRRRPSRGRANRPDSGGCPSRPRIIGKGGFGATRGQPIFRGAAPHEPDVLIGWTLADLGQQPRNGGRGSGKYAPDLLVLALHCVSGVQCHLHHLDANRLNLRASGRLEDRACGQSGVQNPGYWIADWPSSGGAIPSSRRVLRRACGDPLGLRTGRCYHSAGKLVA